MSTVLELLEAGSHPVAVDDLYGGSWWLFERVRARSAGFKVTYCDPYDPRATAVAVSPATRMIWVESPSNPLPKPTDFPMLAELGRKHNVRTVCDNTFASPYVQRPLEHGFDIVIQSVTKYINGHSDVV